MKGLLIKDFYTLLRQMKLFLVCIIVLSLLPNMSLSGLAVMYAAMLPITALAYDERSKWDNLAAMMPYTSTEMILSKYVIGYLGIAVSSGLTCVIELIMVAVRQTTFTAERGMAILLVGCAGLALLAVVLPFLFWLGVEKGRVVYFLIIAATVFIGMMAGQQAQHILGLIRIAPVLFFGAVIASTVLLNAASIWIASSLYRKKAR